MGFFSGILKATVSTALLPLDAASDTVRAVQGKAPKHTERSLEEISDDFAEALENLLDDED